MWHQIETLNDRWVDRLMVTIREQTYLHVSLNSHYHCLIWPHRKQVWGDYTAFLMRISMGVLAFGCDHWLKTSDHFSQHCEISNTRNQNERPNSPSIVFTALDWQKWRYNSSCNGVILQQTTWTTLGGRCFCKRTFVRRKMN